MQTSRVTVRIFEDEGTTIYNEHDGWTVAASRELHYSIEPDDPESCKAEVTRKEAFSRRDWEITTRTHTVTSANRTHFLIRAELEAKHGDLVVHVQKWNRKIPRDLV
jgi:hypothetical protein